MPYADREKQKEAMRKIAKDFRERKKVETAELISRNQSALKDLEVMLTTYHLRTKQEVDILKNPDLSDSDVGVKIRELWGVTRRPKPESEQEKQKEVKE
jgi:hypothetical protein